MLALLATSFALWRQPAAHRINQESFGKIKKGMTQAEVAEILGVLPGNYSRHETPEVSLFVHDFSGNDWTGLRVQTWMSEELWIDVGFSEEGLVLAKVSEHLRPKGFFQRFVRWCAPGQSP